MSSLRRLGYSESFAYAMGSLKDQKALGWRGTDPSLDVKDITQRISVIKTIKDCPVVIYTMANFEMDGRFRNEKMNSVSLTRAIYPNGRCCKVFKNSGTHTNSKISFFVDFILVIFLF